MHLCTHSVWMQIFEAYDTTEHDSLWLRRKLKMPITQERMKVSKTNKKILLAFATASWQQPLLLFKLLWNGKESLWNPTSTNQPLGETVGAGSTGQPKGPLSFSAACEESPALQKWLTEAHTEEQRALPGSSLDWGQGEACKPALDSWNRAHCRSEACTLRAKAA